MGGGIGDWFKKAKAMGTQVYDYAQKHRGDAENIINAGRNMLGGRLFGDRPGWPWPAMATATAIGYYVKHGRGAEAACGRRFSKIL